MDGRNEKWLGGSAAVVSAGRLVARPARIDPVGKQATTAEGDAVGSILAARKGMPGALLPILHDIQDLLGYIPADSIGPIAAALDLSRAEVHGVITYYHHFRQTPPGRHVVRVCRAEACQAVGAEALFAHALSSLGCGPHETSADGSITLEPVFCLGLCASGPAVMVDDETVHGRMNAAAFDVLADHLRQEK